MWNVLLWFCTIYFLASNINLVGLVGLEWLGLWVAFWLVLSWHAAYTSSKMLDLRGIIHIPWGKPIQQQLLPWPSHMQPLEQRPPKCMLWTRGCKVPLVTLHICYWNHQSMLNMLGLIQEHLFRPHVCSPKLIAQLNQEVWFWYHCYFSVILICPPPFYPPVAHAHTHFPCIFR